MLQHNEISAREILDKKIEFLNETRRYELMIEQAMEGLKDYPDDPSLLYNIALAYRKLNQNEPAKAYIEKALSLDPESFDKHLLYGGILMFLGDYQNSAREFEAAISLRPDRWEGYERYAMLLMGINLNNAEKAASLLSKAVELNPSDALIHTHLAEVLTELGRVDEAENEYKVSLELLPEYETFANYALFMTRQGKLQEANPIYKAALTMAPDSQIVHNYKEIMDRCNADERYYIEVVEEYWIRVLANNIKFPEAHLKLAEFYMKHKRNFDAMKEFKEYLKKRSMDLETKLMYGECMHHIGKENEASDYFCKLKVEYPDNPEILEYVEKYCKHAGAAPKRKLSKPGLFIAAVTLLIGIIVYTLILLNNN